MKYKKGLLQLFKLLFSFFLIGIIIYNINWHETANSIKNANLYLIILAIAISLTIQILMVYKWSILITTKKIKISIWKLFNINMIGSFLGLFFPSSLSTDLVRGYYLAKANSNKTISVSSIVVDRFLGTLSLSIFAILGLIFSQNLFSSINLTPYFLIISFLLIIPIAIFFSSSLAYYIKKLINKITFKNINLKILKVFEALIGYKKYPNKIIYSFLISIIVQLLRISRVYIIAQSLNISIEFYYFFIIVPIVIVIIMLPISIGGLGVREGVMVALLKLIGIKINDAILITIIATLTATFVTLLGGISYMFYKNEVNKDIV